MEGEWGVKWYCCEYKSSYMFIKITIISKRKVSLTCPALSHCSISYFGIHLPSNEYYEPAAGYLYIDHRLTMFKITIK